LVGSAGEVDLQILGGERLPSEDSRFDCPVSTFTLCSIEDVAQALRQVYRVLKSSGTFLFLEHGLSRDPKMQKWQRRLNWLQVRLANGCHLDRDMKVLVAAQPFAWVEVEEFYLERTPNLFWQRQPRKTHLASELLTCLLARQGLCRGCCAALA
jgi:SAM-dependent methyltransferase